MRISSVGANSALHSIIQRGSSNPAKGGAVLSRSTELELMSHRVELLSSLVRGRDAPGGVSYGLAQPADTAAGIIPASSRSTRCLQRCNSLQITAGTCMEENPGATIQTQHTA